MSKRPIVVVAIGGNALVQEHQRGTFDEQLSNITQSVDALVGLLRQGYRLIVTHGNGPQVGNLYLQGEMACAEVPAMPLDVYGAETQGQIGYIIELALGNRLQQLGMKEEIATIITRVEVDAADPNFTNPTKPVGPFYSKEVLDTKLREKSFSYVEDSGRGYRRVVASPKPKRILQDTVIRTLADAGTIVVAGGGGGIPVIRDAEGNYSGAEAVIDKDRTSALLASAVGADFLLILTGVPRIAVDFGKATQRFMDSMTIAEARKHMADGQFPAGSMGPKVEAAIEFVEHSNGAAIITTLEDAAAALAGTSGTRIVR